MWTDERITQTSPEVTVLLNRFAAGDPAASQAAWAYFQDDVRRLAERVARGESRIPDLQPTVIINEVWLRLFAAEQEMEFSSDELPPDDDDARPVWEHRGHFWCAIAQTVKCYLIDEHRRANAQKRGGGWKRIQLEIAIGELEDASRFADMDIPALHDAMARMRNECPLTLMVVEHRYLLGKTVKQTAACLGVSPRTVDSHWQLGRAWLRRELSRSSAEARFTSAAG